MYHMMQISNDRKIDKIDILSFLLAIANVVTSTDFPIFYSSKCNRQPTGLSNCVNFNIMKHHNYIDSENIIIVQYNQALDLTWN